MRAIGNPFGICTYVHGCWCRYTHLYIQAHTYAKCHLQLYPTQPPPHSTPNPSQAPATAELAQVFEGMKDLGVLMGKGGLYGNVFRIKPPMCFNKADADFLADVMDHCLAKL